MQNALNTKANDDRVDETSSILTRMADVADTKASNIDLQNKFNTSTGLITWVLNDFIANKGQADTRLDAVKRLHGEDASKLQTLENKLTNDLTQLRDETESVGRAELD
jgi:capsule polysaccharide export protein KpsE/RkpR